MDDPIIREYLRPVSLVYDADIQTILPPRQLKEFLDIYLDKSAFRTNRFNEGLEDLFNTITLGTPDRTRFNAQLERFRPTQELRQMADDLIDPEDPSTLGLFNYIADIDKMLDTIITEFPGVEVPKFGEIFEALKAVGTKGEFGRNEMWLRFSAQLKYHNALAEKLDQMPPLARDWIHQFLATNYDNLKTSSHLSDSLAKWNPDKFVGQNQRLIYRGLSSSKQAEVDAEGNLILYLQDQSHWGEEFGVTSFSTSPEQALRYTTGSLGGGDTPILITFDADATARAFGVDGLHQTNTWDMASGSYTDVPSQIPQDQQAGMMFLQESRAPFGSETFVGHGEIAGWVKGLNPKASEHERLYVAMEEINDVILNFNRGKYGKAQEGMPKTWGALSDEQRGQFFDMSRLEDQPILPGDASITIPKGKWSAISTQNETYVGGSPLENDLRSRYGDSVSELNQYLDLRRSEIQTRTIGDWEKSLIDG